MVNIHFLQTERLEYEEEEGDYTEPGATERSLQDEEEKHRSWQPWSLSNSLLSPSTNEGEEEKSSLSSNQEEPSAPLSEDIKLQALFCSLRFLSAIGVSLLFTFVAVW